MSDVFNALHSRLETTEKVAFDLVKALKHESLFADQQTQHALHADLERLSSNEVLMKDIMNTKQAAAHGEQHLVQRVCRMESVIHTLKMNLLRAQTDRDLCKKEQFNQIEKYNHACEAYDRELSRLNNTKKKLERDALQKDAALESAKKELDKLIEQNREYLQAQSSAQLEVSALRAENHKYEQRIATLKDEVQQESELRATLEKSHTTLLGRIHDLENVVEAERAQVTKLNLDVSELKEVSEKMRENLNKERKSLEITEEGVVVLRRENGDLKKVNESLAKEKQMLMEEFGKMKAQYKDVNEQIDQMSAIVQDKQQDTSQLQSENKRLSKALSLLESERQTYKETNSNKVLQQEEEIQSLKEQLQVRASEAKDNEALAATADELKQQLTDATGVIQKLESEVEQMKQDVIVSQDMQEKLQQLEKERDEAIKDKDSLLDEVNQAVDGMSEEKSRLEADLEKLRAEITGMEKEKNESDAEMRRLRERVETMMDQQNAQQQIQNTLSSITEQKNKLAYEKGRLENQVVQLTAEIGEMKRTRDDCTQLKQVIHNLKEKLRRSHEEKDQQYISLQQLELVVKQNDAVAKKRNDELISVRSAYEQSQHEVTRLQEQLSALEKLHSKKIHELERCISESHSDNDTMSATLEAFITTHTSLQSTAEGLQVQLGTKDQQIAMLVEEKADLQQERAMLERKCNKLDQQIIQLTSQHEQELQSHREQNEKIGAMKAKTIEDMKQLKMQLIEAKASLEKADEQIAAYKQNICKLEAENSQIMDNHRQEVKALEEQLADARSKAVSDRDKNLKKYAQDLSELSGQVEKLSSRNSDLADRNVALESRLSSSQSECAELKKKSAVEHQKYKEMRKLCDKQTVELAALESLKLTLHSLEQSKKESIVKIKDQSEAIRQYTSKMASLQSDISTLAAAYQEMSTMSEEQECEIQLQREIVKQLNVKYKAIECQLETERLETKEKLKQANIESERVSESLRTAQEWFKSKVDTLRTDITTTHDKQTHDCARKQTKRGRASSRELAEQAKRIIEANDRGASELEDADRTTREIRNLRLLMESQSSYNGQTPSKEQRHYQVSRLDHTEQLSWNLT